MASERVGTTSSSVTLCMHYRKYLGKILDVAEEDLLVYWRSVNDRGGIHGRKIDERFAEDGAGRLVAQAYEECRQSFLLRGGPGAEGITPMRKIVESDPDRCRTSTLRRGPIPLRSTASRSSPPTRRSAA